MNRSAYQALIDEDIAWLMQQPRTLERDHIAMIVLQSIDTYYPTPPAPKTVKIKGQEEP
jgi:hypothetical protein